MTAAGVSPSSSPRLPSPPPFTEVQIGPQSPSVGEAFGRDADLLGVAMGENDASTRRIRPGTKSADMASGPPVIPISQIDSPFPFQEHLKAKFHELTNPKGSDKLVPITIEDAQKLASPPDEDVDESIWLYELCRFFTIEANRLITGFLEESPPCSVQTCPEMKVNEWQYICAAHGEPQYCCAIDYCCHTLDWAMNILSSDQFSRVDLKVHSAKILPDIFRRLYRIFAHAWFRHRNVFKKVDDRDGLYVFFKTVCVTHKLLKENQMYTIPPVAGGPDLPPKEEKAINSKARTILRKEDEPPFGAAVESQDPALVTGATTRRHKHSPSTGSRVTSIAEDAEDSEEIPPSQLRGPLKQSPEPRPVSVLEIQSKEEPTTADDTPTDVGEPSEERVEESQEQSPQEPYEQPSETPEDQEKIERVEHTEQTKQPVSEESATNTESSIDEHSTEEKTTSSAEATPAEEPKAKIEAAQEPSVSPETKDEPKKEES
ncbi:Mob1/phocein [Penicillium griseofulvum]|uniref:Mob1/phocein n=1 Tax=Penicillium patulum TaxID=5078 RepID=A0A135LNF4_PENPA|nr:Mob1/phocein [Penicillium griseofulvum]KXG50492.1 Mob1/phocein [Penicillium griseofulvum]